MKKLLLLVLGLAIVGVAVYYAVNLPERLDETKTEAEQKTMPITATTSSVPSNDLTLPELEEFDQDINSLDQSISQL